MSRRTLNTSSSEEEVLISAATAPDEHLTPPQSPQAHRIKRSRPHFDDGLIQEPYRVAGPICINMNRHSYSGFDDPRYPAPLQKFISDHQHQFFEILRQYSMTAWDLVQLRLMQDQHDASGEGVFVVTVYIRQQRSSLDWVAAARTILKLCQSVQPDINIEFGNPALFREPRISCALSPNDPCIKIWDEVEVKVYELLSVYPEALSFRLTCRGRYTDLPEDDFCPTILVKVDGDQDWKDVSDDIVLLLEQYPDYERCAVEIIRARPLLLCDNAVTKHWFDSPSLTEYNKVFPGMSIGVAKRGETPSTAGTFCCLLKLKMADGSVEIRGLTNWHVVRPTIEGTKEPWKDEDLEKVPDTELNLHREGFNASTQSEEWPIYAPAILDVNIKRSVLKKRLDEALSNRDQIRTMYGEEMEQLVLDGKHDEAAQTYGGKSAVAMLNCTLRGIASHQEALVRIESREKDTIAGKVTAGSGFRCVEFRNQPDDSTLILVDWALVRMKQDRLVLTNRVPTNTSSEAAFPMPLSADRFSTLLCYVKGWTTREGATIYKYGRKSKLTSGVFGKMKETLLQGFWDRILCGRDAESGNRGKAYAHVVETRCQPQRGEKKPEHSKIMAETGDSGAPLYNGMGTFVGLLFAGWENHQDSGCMYVPASVLFEDIKLITNAVEVSLIDD